MLALIVLAGCGSATSTHSESSRAGGGASPGSSPAGGSGSTSSSAGSGAESSYAAANAGVPSPSCAAAVAGTLGYVATRIYHEAASGGNVAQAVHRMQSSSALATAIDSDNASAARAALRALLLKQIVRVQVRRSGRVFASAGAGPAIAPVRGTIPGTRASFVLSTQSDRTYMQVVHQVTGAQMLLLAGTRRVAGTIAGAPSGSIPNRGPVTIAGKGFQAFTLGGSLYPSGALRVVLLAPAPIACSGSSAQARVETLGHVGENIYVQELHSPDVAKTLAHVESSSAFRRAVAQHDATATRAAIVGFFEQHIHVVRVRVTVGGRLLVDVGGPDVLAPVHGVVRSAGHVVGDFEMAIQDDAGYLKLAHLFTGAQVLMRRGSEQVMGTLSPGPASIPDRGNVSYGGRSYRAYSFTGVAFPSGRVRISLLQAS
jgi:hypothetical protein